MDFCSNECIFKSFLKEEIFWHKNKSITANLHLCSLFWPNTHPILLIWYDFVLLNTCNMENHLSGLKIDTGVKFTY